MHTYHEILMHIVSVHGSVHNDRIPNLIYIVDKEPPYVMASQAYQVFSIHFSAFSCCSHGKHMRSRTGLENRLRSLFIVH